MKNIFIGLIVGAIVYLESAELTQVIESMK